MKANALFLLTAGGLLFLTGCDHKPPLPKDEAPEQTAPGVSSAAPKTYETLHVERAIDSYQKYPSTGNEAEVERALSELSTEIATLQERAAKQTGAQQQETEATAKRFIDYQEKQALRFAKAKMSAKEGTEKKAPAESLSQEAKEAVEKAKDVAKDALRDAAKATEDAARKAREKLENGRE